VWHPAVSTWTLSIGNQVFFSSDGVNWTGGGATLGSTGKFRCGASDSTGRVVVIAGGGLAKVSNDGGAFWSTLILPSLARMDDMCYNGSVFCMVGEGCMTSPDGFTWTTRTLTGSHFRSVAWGNSRFVAVGDNGVAATAGADGATWTNRTMPPDMWNTVVWSDTLSMFVAGSMTGGVAVSRDGVTWTLTAMLNSELYDIVWTGSFLVAMGAPTSMDSQGSTNPSSLMFFSTDAITWKRVPSNGYLATLFWTGEFLLGGGNTFIVYSGTFG
jgi:hypothetical protein